MNKKIYWSKKDNNVNVIIPTRNDTDNGYDVYACFEEEYMMIPPNKSKLIPTGVVTAFPNDRVILFEERGSTGKINMKRNAGVIEGNYRGEWFVMLFNPNDKPILITKQEDALHTLGDDYIVYPYERAICQALYLKSPRDEDVVLTYEEIMAMESDRGTGKLGSSGK